MVLQQINMNWRHKFKNNKTKIDIENISDLIKEGIAINFLGNKEKARNILFINAYSDTGGKIIIRFQLTNEKPKMVYVTELNFGSIWFKDNPRLRLL